MNYSDWQSTVPTEITDDPLWKTTIYKQSLFLSDLTWRDTRKLIEDRSLVSLSDQLFRAVGSISANVSEGYSRASGKDQARFYEYALGSAREARDWYFKSRHALGPLVADHRLKLLAEIIRQLSKMVTKYRGKFIKEEGVSYETDNLSNLLQNVPLPN